MRSLCRFNAADCGLHTAYKPSAMSSVPEEEKTEKVNPREFDVIAYDVIDLAKELDTVMVENRLFVSSCQLLCQVF